MAASPGEISKVPLQLWLLLCILILIVPNLPCIFYSSIVFVPIIFIAFQTLILPPVPCDISNDLLGVPYNINVRGSKRKKILIAHRTSGLETPENTLAGIRKAKEDGATGVEFDVRFTKDNCAVLMHDQTVDRTTDGSGKLKKMSLREVKKLDASCHHFNHARYKGEPVPTLEEAIELCLELNLKIFWEAKDVDEMAFKTILNTFKDQPLLYEKCAIVSFYPQFLYKLRKNDPKIATVLVWRPQILSMETWNANGLNCVPRFPDNKLKHFMMILADFIVDWCVHNIFWQLCGVSAVFIHKSVISQGYLQSWSRLDMRVVAWVVDDPFEKEYLNTTLGLNYMTDTPRNVLGVVKSNG